LELLELELLELLELELLELLELELELLRRVVLVALVVRVGVRRSGRVLPQKPQQLKSKLLIWRAIASRESASRECSE
jgi:hypothetical protein